MAKTLKMMIKKVFGRYYLVFILLFSGAFITTTSTSCAKKVGCAINDNVGPKTNRDGSLSTKRGKSQLFGKNGKKRKFKKNKL